MRWRRRFERGGSTGDVGVIGVVGSGLDRRPSGCAGSTNDGPGRGRAGQARGRRGVGLDRADVAGRHVDVGVIGVGTFAPNRRWSGREHFTAPSRDRRPSQRGP